MSKIDRIKKDKKIIEAYKAIRKNANKQDEIDRINFKKIEKEKPKE